MNKKRHAAGLLAAAVLVVLVSAREAAAQTWSGGGGADTNWSTAANWVGNAVPASSPTTALTFGGAGNLTAVADLPWTLNRLTVGTAINPWTISGQTLTLAGTAPAIVSSNLGARISNPIVLTGPVAFTSALTGLRLSGTISGTGPVTVNGPGGIVDLTGNDTFTGGVHVVSPGSLSVTGSVLGPVNVDSGGILSGSGTINGTVLVSSGGVLELGPPGALNTGSIGMHGILVVTIDGPAPGIQYGVLNVTGSADVTNATLELFGGGGYIPQPGDVFTIVANDGVDPIVGTFTGLPEGATITFKGVPLRISYVGGTGNDITLTAAAAAAAPPITGVPTLSQWTLLLLAAMLAAIGLATMRTQR